MNAKTPQDVLALCRERGIRAVDFRFTDFLGTQRHLTIPIGKLTEEMFEEGLGFDGSSLRGWQTIHESDMLIQPQPETAWIDPLLELPTLALVCNVLDPITGEDYSRDPRNVARKAANYLKNSGVADTAFFGPEAEFFIFDGVRYDSAAQESYYHIDADEGEWNRGRTEPERNRGGRPLRRKEGYFAPAPADSTHALRNEMMQTLLECGLDVEAHHHEVASAGQAEIDLKYAPLVEMADRVMTFKYVVKNVARRRGKTVTFMPKPLWGDNGNGMHTHFSLWKHGEPLFAGSHYANLSEPAMYAVGGVLKHAPALLAFTNPTTNSYKRLVPGYEAPVHLAYSQRNRSAAVRIPMISPSPKSKRFEFRCPDPSCNPYLAFAAILMAAVDGIQNKIHPGEPLDRDLYDLPKSEQTRVRRTPQTLEEALRGLEEDHDFLLRGEVFTPDVIESWLRCKRRDEIEPMQQRPHPYEFCLYYDC